MELTDLLRALPGLFVLGIVPGVSVAALVAPSWAWWQRLAMAPGLSAGVIGVLGLVLHDLHVGFSIATVLPVVGVLAGVAAVQSRRRGSVAADGLARRRRLTLAGAALVGGLLTSLVVAVSFQGSSLPTEVDAPIHGAVAAGIARQHDFIVAQPIPIAASDSVRPRAAFEAVAALVSELGGPSPVASMLPVTLLAVLLLPLSLAVLMFEATGSWRIAALASVLGIGMSFPGQPVLYGQYPYVLDATLVVPVVIAARRAFLGVDRTRNLALLGALVASIWVIHGLEILTAAVIVVPFAAASLRGRPVRQLGVNLALVLAAVAGGALVVTVLTRVPVTPPEQNPAGLSPASLAPLFLGHEGSLRDSWRAAGDFVVNELLTPLALALYLLGVLAALRTRRLRWVLVANVVLLLTFADVGWGAILHRVWTVLSPWSNSDRLLGIQYFAVPLLMAWGIANHGVVLPRAVRAKAAAAGSSRSMAALGAGVALTAAIWGGVLAGERLHDQVRKSSLATAADVAVIQQMNATLPHGALVLTDGELDAGQWIDALTRDLEWEPIGYDRTHLYEGKPFVTSPQAMALSDACSDPAGAQLALRGVDAVFIGSRELTDAAHPWSLDCLERLPGLHPLVRVTRDGWTAAVLSVAPATTG